VLGVFLNDRKHEQVSMKTKDLLWISIVVGVGGVLIASVIPYARTHFSTSTRVFIIFLTYLTCFGSLVLLEKVRKREQVSRGEAGRFVLVSSVVLIGVMVYEKAQSSTAHLWIAVTLLAIGVVVAGFRTSVAWSSRLIWTLLAVASAIVMWLLAR
jgi:hypothetical protein